MSQLLFISATEKCIMLAWQHLTNANLMKKLVKRILFTVVCIILTLCNVFFNRFKTLSAYYMFNTAGIFNSNVGIDTDGC